jgi:hypothetical protein
MLVPLHKMTNYLATENNNKKSLDQEHKTKNKDL